MHLITAERCFISWPVVCRNLL